MKNLQELETEKRELHAQLDNRENFKEVLAKLKKNEAQITEVKTAQMLERVNVEQAKLREHARLVYDCEQPTEDITCNDGSLHKVKAKKYPKLAALGAYCLEFKDGRLTELKKDGKTFYMFRTKYEYGKPTEYTRPATFEDFLKLNGIQPAEITRAQFDTFEQELNAANEELKKAIEKYDNTRRMLDTYAMQSIGLVNQSNQHLYIYEAKKGY